MGTFFPAEVFPACSGYKSAEDKSQTINKTFIFKNRSFGFENKSSVFENKSFIYSFPQFLYGLGKGEKMKRE